MKFLEGKFGNNDLTSSIDNFQDFEGFSRENRQLNLGYIGKFDPKYSPLVKLGKKLRCISASHEGIHRTIWIKLKENG